MAAFFKSLMPQRQNGELGYIYPPQQFRSLLEYEQTRSVRGNHVLSLVVFDVNHSGNGSTKNGYLGRLLTSRTRSIDTTGWLDSQHLGVLLPYTSEEGALKFVNHICEVVAEHTIPQYTIYTYPSNWFFENKEQSSQLHFRHISPEWNTTVPVFPISSYSQGKKPDLVNRYSKLYKKTEDYDASAQNIMPFVPHSLPLWKRAMDIAGASLGLIILSPLMLLIAIFIKVVSPGPILFKQNRVGYMGKIFSMWKFRTMKVNADATTHQKYLAQLINGAIHNDNNSTKPMTKLDDKLEIIPFGKILRNTYLDELPQLFNVLSGEMTLVGPRPPIPYEVEEYLPWHKERVIAVPGMTGLWQVSGKNRLTFKEMVCLDIQYWRKKSLWLDIKILSMTPVVIFYQIKEVLRCKKLRRKGGIGND